MDPNLYSINQKLKLLLLKFRVKNERSPNSDAGKNIYQGNLDSLTETDRNKRFRFH